MKDVIINNQVKLASLDQINRILTLGDATNVRVSGGFVYILPAEYTLTGNGHLIGSALADTDYVPVDESVYLHELTEPMYGCVKLGTHSYLVADGHWAVEVKMPYPITALPWESTDMGVNGTNSRYVGQYTADTKTSALLAAGWVVCGGLVFNPREMYDSAVKITRPEPTSPFGQLDYVYRDQRLGVATTNTIECDSEVFAWLGQYCFPVTIGDTKYVITLAIEDAKGSDTNRQMRGRALQRHWTPALDAHGDNTLTRHENPMFSRDARYDRYVLPEDLRDTHRDVRQDSRRLRLGGMGGRDMTQNSPLRLRDVLGPERVGHVSSAERVDAKVRPTREPRRSIDTLAPHTTFYSGLELEDVKYGLSELGYDQSGLTCTDTGVFNSEYGYRGVIAANHVGLLNDIQDIHDLKEMVKNPEYIVTRIHNTMLPYTDLKAILHHWGFDGTLELDISPHTYFYNGTLSPKYKEILEQAVNTEALRLKQHHLHSDVCTAKKLQSRAVSLGYDSVIVSEPEETTARIVVMGEMTRDDITEVLTGKKSYSGKSTRISTRLSPDKLQAVLTRYGYTDELVYEEKVNIFYRYQYRGYIHDNLLQMLSANGDYRHIRRSITAIKTSKSIADVRAILRTTPYKRRLLDWTIKSTDVVHHLVYLGKLPVDILAVLESPKVD